MSIQTSKSSRFLDAIKFIVLSGIGIYLFMIPLTDSQGQVTITVAKLSKALQENLVAHIPLILLIITYISFIGAVILKLLQKNGYSKQSFFTQLFSVNAVWFTIRGLAVLFISCTYFEVGPSFITSDNTGSMIFEGLLPILFSVFLFAGLFLPLLLNFGLLEFIGTLLIKVMRPIFNLPGRSAVDCIASWLGDGTIGVLLTSKQYEEGFYTRREAAVIGTTFSLVSITFSLVVIDTVGLAHMFLPFYFSVCVATFLIALILPKLPPLSRIPDVYYDGTPRNVATEQIDANQSLWKVGWNRALDKAKNETVLSTIVVNGCKNVLDMWIAVVPIVMAIGTIALIIAEYTPVFKILGLPFLPILMLLGIPEALAASQTLTAGFADMLLPSIMAASIESEMTRFVVACVSVTQLIYLSEVGALLLGSKIPLKFKDLFYIFILRTLISLPIIACIAHFLF
ncbi:MAG: YjiH family protein [Bacilli bacterium]